MTMFYVGQPVVCVQQKLPMEQARYWNVTVPVVGSRYVVRAYLVPDWAGPRLVVEEIKNPDVPYRIGGRIVVQEAAWLENMFAPVTDISELQKLLVGEPIEEDA